MRREQVTLERLREVISYDPDSGVFTRAAKTNRRVVVGAVAGTITPDGYRKISIDGVIYCAHRLAWLYVHGRWPKLLLDHINGKREDNRIANLREVDYSQNGHGFNMYPAGSTGYRGVTPCPRRGNTFDARIGIGGRKKYLGNFKTAEAAHEAYLKAKQRLSEAQ